MGVKVRLFVTVGLMCIAGIIWGVIWFSDLQRETAADRTMEVSEEIPSEETMQYAEEIIDLQENGTEHIHDFVKSVWQTPTCSQGGYYNNICSSCGRLECVTQEPLPHEVEDILVQKGNCMEDTIIRHICKMCGLQVESDTRYTSDDGHSWVKETVDGIEVDCCINCGVVR